MRRLDPLLLTIVVLGLALRLAGAQWGLPNSQHLHSYHPDEVMLVGAALTANPLAGQFDPDYYNYGSLTIFILRVAYDVANVIAPVGPEAWEVMARFHVLGRLLSVLLGAATVLLVFDIGRRLGGRVAGLAAAAVIAVAPGHVVHSHYLTVDVPATFLTAATLSVALRLLAKRSMGMAALAGACAGLAAATKYNASPVIRAPLAARLLGPREGSVASRETGAGGGARRAAGWLGVLGAAALPAAACLVAAAGAFLAGCPGVLLNQQAFLRDILYEARHVQTGHGLLFEKTLPAWAYHVVVSLRFALGIPLLAVALAGIARASRQRSRADLVLAAWVIPYYLLIGAAQVKFLRYTLPLLPPLAVWSGAACADWLGGAGRSRLRALAAAALVGVGFWSLGSAVTCALLLLQPDPRDRAAAWVQTTVPRGATVALTTLPWFYTPPLVPWNGAQKTQSGFEESRPRWPYAFLPGSWRPRGQQEAVPAWTAGRVLQERPACFILSDLDPDIRDGLRLKVPETVALIDALDHGYTPHVFRHSATWPGLFGPGYCPEDWLYPAPTVTVYLRRDLPASALPN